MHRGFVKVYRKILDGIVFSDINAFHLFMYILLSANHKEGFAYGQKIEIGQLLTGRKVLASIVKKSESGVEKILKRLEKYQLITQKSSNKYRIITVLEWDKFAEHDSRVTTKCQQGDNKVTTKCQQGDTNNNDNNDNNDKKRGFTPPSFDEVNAYCKERNNNVDPGQFIDFYSGKGWFVGKNKMKDWKACVRTWERRYNNKPKTFKQIDQDREKQVIANFLNRED